MASRTKKRWNNVNVAPAALSLVFLVIMTTRGVMHAMSGGDIEAVLWLTGLVFFSFFCGVFIYFPFSRSRRSFNSAAKQTKSRTRIRRMSRGEVKLIADNLSKTLAADDWPTADKKQELSPAERSSSAAVNHPDINIFPKNIKGGDETIIEKI